MNLKITLTLTLIATLIILSAGCITPNPTISQDPISALTPIVISTPTPIPTSTPEAVMTLTIVPTVILTPELNSIDILINDIIKNNIGNKFNYGMGNGGASEYRYSYQIACEQGEYIKDNYNYTCGMVDISDKLYLYGYAQTWVFIDNTTYIIDSMSNTYWTQGDHQIEFNNTRIDLFSLQKGREYAKCMAESWRDDDPTIIEILKVTDTQI